jgi:hypothetical protein
MWAYDLPRVHHWVLSVCATVGIEMKMASVIPGYVDHSALLRRNGGVDLHFWMRARIAEFGIIIADSA